MKGNEDLIRVTKLFSFEMAHALFNYDGPCRNIHGHSYSLAVTIIGKPNMIDGHPENGLVTDFGTIKKIVNEQIIDRFDHALVLNHLTPGITMEELKKQFQKIILVPFQPSCENLLLEIRNSLINSFGTCKLHSLRLHETSTSFCEWNCTDN